MESLQPSSPQLLQPPQGTIITATTTNFDDASQQSNSTNDSECNDDSPPLVTADIQTTDSILVDNNGTATAASTVEEMEEKRPSLGKEDVCELEGINEAIISGNGDTTAAVESTAGCVFDEPRERQEEKDTVQKEMLDDDDDDDKVVQEENEKAKIDMVNDNDTLQQDDDDQAAHDNDVAAAAVAVETAEELLVQDSIPSQPKQQPLQPQQQPQPSLPLSATPTQEKTKDDDAYQQCDKALESLSSDDCDFKPKEEMEDKTSNLVEQLQEEIQENNVSVQQQQEQQEQEQMDMHHDVNPTKVVEDAPGATIAQISPPAPSVVVAAGGGGGGEGTTLLDESILVELQASLQHQMTIRAEVEDKLRHQAAEMESYKKKLDEYSTLEDELEKIKSTLTQSNIEKSALEQEVMKLREGRDDLERKEAVLSNRLNDAKKKEANVSHIASRLEAENEELKKALKGSQEELQTVVAQKQKLENSMEKLKKKCVERVKMSEAALVEERNLNEERKKKMKVFVETKAEELRSAKSTADEMKAKLKETSEALESVRGKLERMTQQYENTSMKNRELTREINRMKKNSEQLHQLGGSLEMELQKSAQETEEHKNKRLTAKHELMTILRKLEAEQAVSGKLRDSVKFTFTPKALSQQQLLQEGLEDFESELVKLSRRLGKPLPPSTYSGGHASTENGDYNLGHHQDSDEHQNAEHAEKKKMNSRSEGDAARLLSSLEHETQQVSKGIMAFTNAVERLHILLDASGEKSCVNTLNEIFGVLAAARGDVRPIAAAGSSSSSTDNGTAHVGEIVSFEDEDGSFSGSPVNKKRSSERHGLVGQGS